MWISLGTVGSIADGLFATLAGGCDDEPAVGEQLYRGVDLSIPFDRRGLLRSGIGGLSALLAGCTGGSESTTDGTFDEPERDVRLIGHCGCADQYPENTIRAVEQSASHVDMIEFDVQRCGSGDLVVFHDGELGRLTDASGRLSATD